MSSSMASAQVAKVDKSSSVAVSVGAGLPTAAAVAANVNALTTTPPQSIRQAPVVEAITALSMGQLILNRPRLQNSLDVEMCQIMDRNLQEWEASPLCKVITIKGAGKAFSAGGDVVRCAQSIRKGNGHWALALAKVEYEVIYYIAKRMTTPVVTIMNGVTMGGAAGVSQSGHFRIATEKTVFAMPEATIGFFTDAGCSYWMSRLANELGTYMAMTGRTIRGSDLVLAGLATHYVPLDQIPFLEQRLAQLQHRDHFAVKAIIDQFAQAPTQTNGIEFTDAHRKLIASVFSHETVEEILSALQAKTRSLSDQKLIKFCQQTHDLILQKSPLSLKVSLYAQRKGRYMSMSDCMQMEAGLAAAIIFGPSDFCMGVEYLLLQKKKDRAPWAPSTLEQIDMNYVKNVFFYEGPIAHYPVPKLDLGSRFVSRL